MADDKDFEAHIAAHIVSSLLNSDDGVSDGWMEDGRLSKKYMDLFSKSLSEDFIDYNFLQNIDKLKQSIDIGKVKEIEKKQVPKRIESFLKDIYESKARHEIPLRRMKDDMGYILKKSLDTFFANEFFNFSVPKGYNDDETVPEEDRMEPFSPEKVEFYWLALKDKWNEGNEWNEGNQKKCKITLSKDETIVLDIGKGRIGRYKNYRVLK